MAVRPDVDAVIVYENGDVAHHTDGPLRAVKPQGMPLFVEGELDGAPNRHLGSEFPACGFQGRWFAAGQPARPMVPALFAVVVPQGIEEDKVFQPPGILSAETLESVARVAGGMFQEVAGGFCEQRQFVSADLVIVDRTDAVR